MGYVLLAMPLNYQNFLKLNDPPPLGVDRSILGNSIT